MPRCDATQKDVGKHYATDHQTCFPRGNIRGALHEFTSADNPDQQIGNDEQHQQNKEYRARVCDWKRSRKNWT